MIRRLILTLPVIWAFAPALNARLDKPDDHALYLSVIEVTQSDRSATMLVKVFSDDLLSAIRNFSGTGHGLSADSVCSAYPGLIKEYFPQHLRVLINGIEASYQVTSCTVKGDTHLLSFTMDAPDGWTTVEVMADYFVELFPAQSNVLTIRANGGTWTARLNKKQVSKTFEVSR